MYILYKGFSDDIGPCQLMMRICSPTSVQEVSEYTHTLFTSPPLLSFSQDTLSIPLGIAAEKGHQDTVKRLVEGEANINHQNRVRTVEHVSW